jgi:hypothetical protein
MKLAFSDGLYLKRKDLGKPDVFDLIYEKDLRKGGESISGGGSSLKYTEDVRRLLPKLISEYGLTSILDVPCGDFHWMKELDWTDCAYTGGDIVSELVEENNRKHQSDRINFRYLDIRTDDLPRVDLILCRDCLIHLSFQDGLKALSNFKKSKSAYLLTTTHPGLSGNYPIKTGDYRPIDLCLPPYNLPQPINIFRDTFEPTGTETPLNPDKSLGLWRFVDLPH